MPTNPSARLKEEQEVYAVLLADAPYRLEENTSLGWLTVDTENISNLLTLNINCDLSSRFTNFCTVVGFPDGTETEPKISRETAFDFRVNNQQSHLLRDYLPSSHPHILANATDIDNLPDHSGWFSVSRVGLNSSLTEALVLLNRVTKIEGHVDVCSQFFEILEKVDSKWVVQKEVQILACE